MAYDDESKGKYLYRENMKRRQLIEVIGSGLRCNVKLEGDFQLGLIAEEDLDVSRETVPVCEPSRPSEHMVSHQRETIAVLRGRNAELRNGMRELEDEHKEWGDKNDRLSARCTKLTKDIQQLRYKFTKLNNDHPFVETVHRLRKERDELKNRLIACEEVTRRIRKERDELLDAATKPTAKPESLSDLIDAEHEKENPVTHTLKGTPRVHKAQLTNEQVWAIRRFVKMNRLNSWISMHLSIPIQTINKVRNNQTYTGVPSEPTRKPVTVKAGKGEVSNDK